LTHLGVTGAEAWRDSRNGCCARPIADRVMTRAAEPAAPGRVARPISYSRNDVVEPIHAHPGRHGTGQCHCLPDNTRELSCLLRRLHRDTNHQHSGHLIAGMVLLLAVCGWILGGEEGARQAVAAAAPPRDRWPLSPDVMLRRLGARLLHPAETPALFEILRTICRRARLARLPSLYYLAHCPSMNAYALGGPDGSAIVFTEGLLHGMTLGEVGAILAHEVAHIHNNDNGAMTWAIRLHQAIAVTALAGLALLPRNSWAGLLGAAPAIAQLLYLALSRIRELDADAAALEWIDCPQDLVAALHKLEHHHAGWHLTQASLEEGLRRFLRSHPATWERVGILMRLGH